MPFSKQVFIDFEADRSSDRSRLELEIVGVPARSKEGNPAWVLGHNKEPKPALETFKKSTDGSSELLSNGVLLTLTEQSA